MSCRQEWTNSWPRQLPRALHHLKLHVRSLVIRLSRQFCSHLLHKNSKRGSQGCGRSWRQRRMRRSRFARSSSWSMRSPHFSGAMQRSKEVNKRIKEGTHASTKQFSTAVFGNSQLPRESKPSLREPWCALESGVRRYLGHDQSKTVSRYSPCVGAPFPKNRGRQHHQVAAEVAH